MKQHFIKVFLISLIIFSTVITTGIFTYAKFMSPEGITQKLPEDEEPIAIDEEDENLTPLEKAMRDSNRINALLLGHTVEQAEQVVLRLNAIFTGIEYFFEFIKKNQYFLVN